MSKNAFIQNVEQELSQDGANLAYIVEQIELYLTDQGASDSDLSFAKIVASKLDRACLRSTFDIITNCQALLSSTKRLFYSAMKSPVQDPSQAQPEQPFLEADEDPRLKPLSGQFALVATSAWVKSINTFQLPRMNVERESSRLFGQYAKYLELVKGITLVDPEALEAVQNIDLATLRSEVSAKLLEPIVGQPNGLFNKSLGCGTTWSKLPKPVLNSKTAILSAKAVIDSRPVLDSKLRPKTGKVAILGAPPVMSALIKKLDREG